MSSFRSTYKQIFLDHPDDNVTLIKCVIAKYINPGYSVLFTYRIGLYLYHSKYKLFRVLALRKRMQLIFKKNCDISFLSRIGNRLRLVHPLGIVIGAGVVIGNNVTIFQNVTLGSDGKRGKQKSYPIIEDGVTIYADSIILGKVRIGKNSVIGAKTLVNVDVPPNSIAVGTPCKIIHTK